jgi:hypothetical protein
MAAQEPDAGSVPDAPPRDSIPESIDSAHDLVSRHASSLIVVRVQSKAVAMTNAARFYAHSHVSGTRID